MKICWMNRVGLTTLLLALSAMLASVAFADNPESSNSDDVSLAATTVVTDVFGETVHFTPPDEHGRSVFMIEFAEPGLLDLHRQTRGAGQRFDIRASDMQSESAQMEARHQFYLDGMSARLGRDLQATHFFQVTHSGMALRLTESEARQIQMLPEVASVQRERMYFLDTFAGPEFIGAGSVWDGSATPDGFPYRGEGMIAGVLDSGILPNHPSFINDPECGHDDDNPKLISFVDCAQTDGAGRCTGPDPVDSNGHGTHVAGTKAGNALLRDSGPTPRPNPPVGDGISGVAKCASIRNYKVCPEATCPGSQIQAGMNNILLDGDVDTMNFSISGGTSPWNDNDRRKLDLVDAGVFVNASAGNSGPSAGTVGHRGPWVVAVAASTRPEGAAGVLSITGPEPVPGPVQNVVMNRGSDSPVGPAFAGDIRYDADQPAGNDGCDEFPEDFFEDAIALVQRGGCTFTTKINNAAAAGAQVVVIWNNEAGTINMSTPGQVDVPAYSITQAQGQAFKDFIDANPGATAAFTLEEGAGGDVLAGFSSRGPTPAPLQNLQKPEITAPGVAIYAADTTASGYGNKSGTSMSGPHLSGAATLVRQMQPDWAPIEVGSALRMTASQEGFKQDGNNPWDWDDVGSGRVDLTRAGLAGLVMDETFDNFLAANPVTGGDVRTLNLPALRDVACNGSCTFTRTVRNTLDEPSSWSVSTEMFSGNFDIVVTPSSFEFSGDTSETQTITVEVFPVGTNSLSFGRLDLVEAGGASPDLHWTLAFTGSGEGGPEPEGVTGFDFEGTVTGISGDITWASDLQMTITGPSGSTFTVGGFGTGAPPWDFDGSGSTNDGTYNSSHPDAFPAGTELDGEWTFTFFHSFTTGVPMTWDPVTVDLTGPGGRNVLATLDVPPFTINGGQTLTFTVPVGEPPPPEDPEIAVDPDSLSATVAIDGTATEALTVSNVGGGTLDFSVFTAGQARTALNGTELFVSGPIVTNPGAGVGGADVSALQTALGMSTFGAGVQQAAGNRISDSFVVDGNWTIDNMTFFVYQTGSTTTSSITGATVRVWNTAPNAGGDVIFGDDTTNRMVSTEFSGVYRTLDTALTNPDRPIMEVVVDLEGLELSPGTYWVDVDFSGSLASGPWMGPISILGETTTGTDSWQFQASQNAWVPWNDTGTNTRQGVPFVINGSSEGISCADPSVVPWLSVAPDAGSLAGGEELELAVSFDADGLATGTYEALVCLSSNDPANSLVTVPVALEVLGPTALVQVAHLAPFDSDLAATEVDVALDGEVILAGVPYGASTGALPVPVGTYDIEIRLAGTSTVVLEALGVELEEGVKYTVIASGDADNQVLALDLLVDDLSPPAAGNFRLRLGHLAPFATGAASAEVRLADGTLVLEVNYRDFDDLELAAGSYDLQITAPGGEPVLIDPIELTFAEGDIISAFAVGDGANQELGVYALPPTDPGFFVPLVGETPVIDVDPDSLSATVDEGDAVTLDLDISNLGNAPLEWSVVEDASGSRVLQAIAESVQPATMQIGSVSGLFSQSGAQRGQVAGPFAIINEGITLTHSTSNQVLAANTVACSPDGGATTSENFFYRTFALADFGIADAFDVNEVTFGIENLSAAQPITVNLFTLDGAFTMANLTPIGSATETLGAQTLSLVTVPVEGTVPAGGTLVVEIAPPDLSGVASFFPGSNSAGETAPSYIRSGACGIAQPATFASIGFPQVQLVMSVTGTTDGGVPNCELPGWVDVDPLSGTVGAGNTQTVAVTLDSDGLAPGSYDANLCIASNDPETSLVEVPLSLTVESLFDPPSIAVDPTELEASVISGGSVDLPLNVANVGDLTLDFSAFTAGEGNSVLTGTELFVSGPIVTNPGAGVGGADVSALQTALGMTTFGAGVQQTAGNRMSDVFEVDGNWTIDTMTFFVYQTGSPPTSTITGATVRVWNTAPNAGGNVIFGDDSTNRLVSTQFSGVYRTLDTALTNPDRPIMEVVVDLEGLQLSPGTYWVDVSFSGSLASGPWMGPISILGETTTGVDSWQFQASQNAWVPFNDGGTNTRQGMPFVVNGSSGASCDNPSDVPWLSVSPTSGSLAGGEDVDLTVSLDSNGLDAGVYEALVCLSSNDPVNPLVTVPVTLEVEFTPDIGILEGTVQSLGYCSANPFAAEGAEISVEGSDGSTVVGFADADGFYSLPISETVSPVSITFSAPDHTSQTVIDVVIVGGETTVVDADLVLEAACATVTPESISFTDFRGSMSEVLTIANLGGGADLEWNLVTEVPDAAPRLTVSLLAEDFEGDFPPEGWTTVDDTGQCPWLTSDDYIMSGWGGTARGAAVDSDACGSGVVVDASLITPALDLSAALNTTISFDLAYRHLGSSALRLDVSTDGEDWTTIETWSANFAYPGATSAPVSFDLSAFDGQPEVFIRWRYTSGWDWWAFVDNVEVTAAGSCYDPMVDTWLSVSADGGTVAADEEELVDVMVDSSGIMGSVTTSLCIATNDEEAPLFVIPVQLDVFTDAIFQDRFEE